MEKSQVTIKDIAKIAGVSFSTVSRCLNNSSQASEKTKRKVQQIASDLGFEFNASARGLITHQVGTVAIVLPEFYMDANVNAYHSMMVNSLRESLEKADVDLIVTYEKNHYSGENNITRLVNRNKIDGFIFLVEKLDNKTLEFLEDKEVPHVFAHFPPKKNLQNQDIVYSDNYTGGRLAAERLLERGRNKFAIISNSNHLEFQLREQGFCDILESRGFEVSRFYCQRSFIEAEKTVRENIEKFRKCNGLFTINDLTAFGAIKALNASGIQVPEDISIIGYDDTEYAKYSVPTLTTVHQPREELAAMACKRLFLQISKMKNEEKPVKCRISIEPFIVDRQSV